MSKEAWEAGKGWKERPMDREKFRKNWDKIFSKKKTKKKKNENTQSN